MESKRRALTHFTERGPVESDLEELMQVHPPPPHSPAAGADIHPAIETIEGPTEASDNRDDLARELELGA